MTISEKLTRLLRKMSVNTHSPRRLRCVRSAQVRLERLEDRCLLTTIDLAALTAAQGTIIYGADI